MRLVKSNVFAVFFALAVAGGSAFATPDEADRAEERARASFVDQFSKFMKDKNVQGKARDPYGKTVTSGKKTRFNEDDGLAFQSDLTYHDFSYNTELKGEEAGQQAQNNKEQKKRLFAHVSNHGGISAAGGSSVLERTAFQLDEKLSKQDENKKQEDQEGIKFRSIFKITTKDVFEGGDDKGNQAKSDDKAKEGEKDKVDRFELRQEARPEIEKVGEQSFETILQSARGEENANDEKALGNGVLLRAAAQEATIALWKSTLANWGQRVMNRGIRSGELPSGPQLQEGVPKCAQWAQAAQSVANNQKDPKKREALLKDVQRMTQQCEQMSGLQFTAINPEFTKEGDNEQLKIQGPQKEDALVRDSRLQLEIMNKAGKSVTEIPSNWQFTKEDDKARMTISYDENQPKEGAKTVKEQLESYNANLQEAEDSYGDIKKRYSDLEVPKPTAYAIQPGTKNMIEINRPPDSAFEEVGISQGAPKTGVIPRTYKDLVKGAQSN